MLRFACMSIIQVRDISEETHRRLKARAAEEGRTLSELIRDELDRVAERPTWAEVAERIASREPVRLSTASAAAVRAAREERDEQLDRP